MDEPVFADKSHSPTETELAETLGRAKTHWDKLVAALRELNPAAATEWKFYSGKSGWTFIARDKRRNLLYLRPLAKRFLASLAFGDQALAAAEDAAQRSELPPEFVQSIRESPKYPEGRAVRVEVSSAADAKLVSALLAIKIAN